MPGNDLVGDQDQARDLLATDSDCTNERLPHEQSQDNHGRFCNLMIETRYV